MSSFPFTLRDEDAQLYVCEDCGAWAPEPGEPIGHNRTCKWWVGRCEDVTCPVCGRVVQTYRQDGTRLTNGHRSEMPHTPDTPWCVGGGRDVDELLRDPKIYVSRGTGHGC